jgi:hypothetical protein
MPRLKIEKKPSIVFVEALRRVSKQKGEARRVAGFFLETYGFLIAQGFVLAAQADHYFPALRFTVLEVNADAVRAPSVETWLSATAQWPSREIAGMSDVDTGVFVIAIASPQAPGHEIDGADGLESRVPRKDGKFVFCSRGACEGRRSELCHHRLPWMRAIL